MLRMRSLVVVLPALWLAACGEHGGGGPATPTPLPLSIQSGFQRAVGGPMVGQGPLAWFPGPVERIEVGQVVRSTVDPAGHCIRDPQHACRRFSIIPHLHGTLHVDVTYDAATIGHDPKRNGEVVIIDSLGGWVSSFAGSGGLFDTSAYIVVEAGASYEVIAVEWEPTVIPFELRTRLEDF